MPHPACCVDYGALVTAMAARVTWRTKKLGAATSGKQTSGGELRFGRWLLGHSKPMPPSVWRLGGALQAVH
jgi:hypothetical protein